MNHNDGKLNPGDKASDPKAAKKLFERRRRKLFVRLLKNNDI